MSEARIVIDDTGQKYELTELLGRGGQGAVYAVKDRRLAVKLVADKGEARRVHMRNQLEFVRRLPLSDLALAKPLRILRPPATGYVMELMTGMVPINTLLAPPKSQALSVDWYLKSGGLRRRLLVLGRTASVLAQLHGKGLAYADPSPANIFVSAALDYNEVWFIDTDNLSYEDKPRSKGGVYTPFYGAPELVRGESGVTTLTDIHAFAVIAFQVLTLAHPFIGDLVNDGDPDLEEQALKGLVPWIDDADDDSNRASFGVPRPWVLSRRLEEHFALTFGAGRTDPMARPGASAWAERLFAAADATIACSACGGAYYLNEQKCPWCEANRPTFAAAVFHLWDPSHGPHGGILSKPADGKLCPVRVGHGAVTEGNTLHITRRLAFAHQPGMADEPVIEATLFAGNQLRLKSLDGNVYRLISATDNQETEVGEREQTITLASGQASWGLHLGDNEHLHRVVSFEPHPGRMS